MGQPDWVNLHWVNLHLLRLTSYSLPCLGSVCHAQKKKVNKNEILGHVCGHHGCTDDTKVYGEIDVILLVKLGQMMTRVVKPYASMS